MKTLKDFKLKDMKGEPLKIGNEEVSFFTMLGNYCGSHTTKDGRENIRMFKMGMKLLAESKIAPEDKKPLEFEDADFSLLKKTIEREQPLYTSLAAGQLYGALIDAEKEGKE